MIAYEDVARNIGTSAEWLRKFIKGTEAKEPGWTVGWNLIDHCNMILCTCVEQEIETERLRIEALRREINAANSTLNQMVEGASRAKATGPFIGKDP